jgi:cytochrome c-type biogenesis protein CcmE
MNRGKILTIAVSIVLVAAGVAIVASSMSSGTFSLSVAETLERRGSLVDREFKVAGRVAEGSVSRGPGPFDLAFDLADPEDRRLSCRYKGAVPDPFAPGREVILQGRLAADFGMEVSRITVKCPSKYQEEGVDAEKYGDYYRQKYDREHRGSR